MEQFQQCEWHEVQSRTWQHLRSRGHILRSRHHPLLQYLVRPSLTDTWCIDFVRTGDKPGAFCTVWETTTDIHAFTSPIERLKHPDPFVPTIASTRIAVDCGKIESMLDRLGRIQLPLKEPTHSISIDGVAYELQIGDGWSGILLQWHNVLPDEWPPELRDLLAEIHEMANPYIKQSSEEFDAP